MDNSLLKMNLEKNFTYHEILTDSDNIVKDLARLLALSSESEEIVDNSGVVVKPAAPIPEKCWEVIYPKADRTDFPTIGDWNQLLPEEYREVTNSQIEKITDTVILKTKTIPKDIVKNNSTAMGVNQDLNVDSIEMYLEIYMPPYLCDSETNDALSQRDGVIPKVLDVNGLASGNTRVARNYHHLFMRIFDNINDEKTGPADNVIDPSTRDVTKWNSRSSNWSKLSWYTDFENKFKAPLLGQPEKGMLQGSVRIPVLAGLTSESKIKIWANVNTSRVVLGVMGSPNVDFSDNRYLIGCAYIGQIDSFDFSINDTAGNFGLFTTSSTSPAMAKTITKVRPSKPAIISGNTVTPGTGQVGSGTKLPFATNLQIFNPATVYSVNTMEIPNIPYDYNQPNGGTLWGNRFIDIATVRVYTAFNRQPDAVEYIDGAGNTVIKTIGIQSTATLSPKAVYDEKDRTKITISITINEILVSLIGRQEAANVLSGSSIKFGNLSGSVFTPCTMNMTYNFSYYTEYTQEEVGVIRDSYGNSVAENHDTTYGKNTATGVTDFSMYTTYTKDYFQKHYFMFASTEEYMIKELYGKSSYTNEFFADKIKVVHSSEGPRGVLSGMITIDTSSLYPFDELIVNKDFEKYDDKPEELYIHLPITAPYCPFSNSPNGRHGIGILKDIRYPIPVSDEEIVRFAINEIDRKYSDLDYVTEDFLLIESSQYGATISWDSSNRALIDIQ